jgi:hypothetical protein
LNRKYYMLSMVSGCVWAALAYVLAHEALGEIIWGGVIASPLVGVAAGAIFQPACSYSGWKKLLLSLGTLYVAVGLFGLAAGIYDAFRFVPNSAFWAVVVQPILGCWWGITMTGMVAFLWPMSFLNHSLLCSCQDSTSREVSNAP